MDIIDDVSPVNSDDELKPFDADYRPPALMARATEARLIDQDDDHVKIVIYFKDQDYEWHQVKMMIHRSNLKPIEPGGPGKEFVLSVPGPHTLLRLDKEHSIRPPSPDF